MWARIKKYSHLYWAFCRASIIADFEFRLNVVLRVATDVLWNIAQIATFEVLFRQTSVMGGWTLPQMRVFLGVLFVVDALYMFFVHENLHDFSSKVRKGEMDLLLAKPADSQFIMSLQRACTPALGNLIIAMGWLSYCVSRLEGNLGAERILWFLVLVPCGLIVVYAGRFYFATLSLFYTRAENLEYLFYQIYRLGMRPDAIYQPWLKYIVLTILPAAMIASVPARAIIDPPNRWLYVWAIALAITCAWLTTVHWKRALRSYASASS